MSDPGNTSAGVPFNLNGTTLLADPSGALFWPRHRLLAIADLHLEKGAAFAARGQPLPPYDTPDTLAAIERLMAIYEPATVIALGDSFHRADSHLGLSTSARQRLLHLTGQCRWAWIAGNHDPAPPRALGGEGHTEITIDGLTFRHQPASGASPGEIAGHLHPVAKISVRGRSFRRRCFAVGVDRMVMPAMGAYAGGLNVKDPAFSPLFGALDFHVLMLGSGKVHRFEASKLRPDRRAA